MSITVKALHFFMILIFLTAFSNIANAADFSGIGDGTEKNPFQIATFSQLDEVRYNLSANYILMNDLDFNDFSGDWIPLGFPQNSDDFDDYESFTGGFNGNNKTIHNLTMDVIGSEIGLFYCIEFEGKVSNLTMENAKIIGDSNVGVIAGIIRFSGSAVNCKVINSTVSAFGHNGGIAGSNLEGLIDSCSVINSNIIASGNVVTRTNGYPSGISGGIVSGNNGGIIKNSNVENTIIQSQQSAGGIAGVNNFQGKIENSSVINCSIKSEASLINFPFGSCGGIAGVNAFGGIIGNSSALNCSIKLETSSSGEFSEFDAGGIVGHSSWSSIIVDCQASGEIENNGVGGSTGGIVGNASVTEIINCISFSSVTSSRFGDVGGIAGVAEGCRIENCSALNSEINQFESFSSIREDYSILNFIYFKIKYNAGYIAGESSKNQINDCVYSDKIESNKPIFFKNGSNKVNYVGDWTGFYT